MWGPAAQELLCALFLSAAVSGRSLRDVAHWLDDTASPTPAELLDAAGFRALASSLRGAQQGAPETRDGIYQTPRTAAACLHDEEIMPWVTPPQMPLPAFSPADFAASRDTLYPADRVPGGGVPAGRRADRHGHVRRPTARRAGRRPTAPPDGPDLDEAATTW